MTAIYRAIMEGRTLNEHERAETLRPERLPRAAEPRTAEAVAACRAICALCEHFTEAEYGVAACDLIRCAPQSTAPCPGRYERRLLHARCPLELWPGDRR